MRDFLQSFRLLFLWQTMRLRGDLVWILLIQVALGLGVVYGLAFLIPEIDSRTALYLTTGAPTLTLLIMGLNVVQQEATQARLSGRAAYLESLPVPRLAPPAAEISFWLLAQLPGMVITLVVASLRFDLHLNINPSIVPAILLVALTGSSVGFAMGKVLKPEVASQLSSFISLGILLFAPINFPAERLPEFLQAIHAVLPIEYMADIMRWSLSDGVNLNIGLALGIVALWCVAGIAASWRVATRQR